MLGNRIVLAAALAAATCATVAVPSADASVFSEPKPFRVEGTVSARLDGGRVLVISPVTGGTEFALQRAAASGGEFRINVEGVPAQPNPYVRSDDYYCGIEEEDYAGYIDVCGTGAAVEIFGTFDKNGPLKNSWTAELARPVSGFGNTEFLDHTIVLERPLLDEGDPECRDDACSTGYVSSGPFGGYAADLQYSCNGFGYDATLRLSQAEHSVTIRYFNTDKSDLLALDDNGPEFRGESGRVVEGTGKFAGAVAAAFLSDPCEALILVPTKEVWLETEFAEPSPI